MKAESQNARRLFSHTMGVLMIAGVAYAGLVCVIWGLFGPSGANIQLVTLGVLTLGAAEADGTSPVSRSRVLAGATLVAVPSLALGVPIAVYASTVGPLVWVPLVLAFGMVMGALVWLPRQMLWSKNRDVLVATKDDVRL